MAIFFFNPFVIDFPVFVIFFYGINETILSKVQTIKQFSTSIALFSIVHVYLYIYEKSKNFFFYIFIPPYFLDLFINYKLWVLLK